MVAQSVTRQARNPLFATYYFLSASRHTPTPTPPEAGEVHAPASCDGVRWVCLIEGARFPEMKVSWRHVRSLVGWPLVVALVVGYGGVSIYLENSRYRKIVGKQNIEELLEGYTLKGLNYRFYYGPNGRLEGQADLFFDQGTWTADESGYCEQWNTPRRRATVLEEPASMAGSFLAFIYVTCLPVESTKDLVSYGHRTSLIARLSGLRPIVSVGIHSGGQVGWGRLSRGGAGGHSR